MIIRFLVLFTALILIGTIVLLEGVKIADEQIPSYGDSFFPNDMTLYATIGAYEKRERDLKKSNFNRRMGWYKTMLLSILGMWSLVLGLRWAITGKWILWGKKE